MPFRSRLPMMWALVLVGLASARGSARASSDALDVPPLSSSVNPIFTAEVAVAVDSAGSLGLAVTVHVPYGELGWVRVRTGYQAKFEATVVFEPQRGGPSVGDSWQRRLDAFTLSQTSGSSQAAVERRVFTVSPGRWELRVHVEDLNTSARSSASRALTVPNYSRAPLTLADLVLGVIGPNGTFESRPTRRFGYDSDRLAASAVVIDRRAGDWPRTYNLQYRILGESGEELLRGTRAVSAGSAGAPVVLRPDSAALFVGTYALQVELDYGKARLRLEREFEVEESGPPRGREFERMLEPLSYIASPDEIDALRRLPSDEERAKAWVVFWKRRDPTPDTPRNEALVEFLARVRYVEGHFQHFGPGWRSDMGRIYIKFGPPDQTESHPATADSPATEVWYYEHPRRQFVFADNEGFGRYVLMTPEAE